jgi:hypothetical protein
MIAVKTILTTAEPKISSYGPQAPCRHTRAVACTSCSITVALRL